MLKAMLLAAGLGSRLEEKTRKTPKCLIKVHGQTMLDHWIYKLDRLGVQKFLINTHYLHTQVVEFWKEHPLKNRIELLHEPTLLGTAATLKKNLQYLRDDTAFIVHADNYCEDRLLDMLNAFKSRQRSSIMTMLTFTTETPEECGVVVLDSKNMMVEFHEKATLPPTNIANGAVYIASKEFFDFLSNCEDVQNLSEDVLPLLRNKINCYLTKRFFIDIGTPQNLSVARNKVL